MTKSCVFVSGNGSILSRIIDEGEQLGESLGLVVSSRPTAPAIGRAHRSGVPVWIFSKSADWLELSSRLQTYGIGKIFLAGFMRILPPEFIIQWRGRIWNIHPSLLPIYPGKDSIERANSDRAPLGVTVHEVDESIDGGKIQDSLASGTGSKDWLATARVHRDEQILIRKRVCEWLRR